ncbi:MAG: restriction endonuclease, partial [Alphaproteobacteria bacterium]|nr:restriction endonuclease [Alphaproteobacteria bacterium]
MRVSELFDIKYGINLELDGLERSDADDAVNFVARTSENNGVVARVKPIAGKEPQPAGILTCAGGGSVLSTFVQDKPFYSGRDLYLLIPKQEMTLEEKLFYCHAIKMNAYRYSYGRQANR